MNFIDIFCSDSRKMPTTRGRGSRGSGLGNDNNNRRSSTPIGVTNKDYDDSTRAMVNAMLERGLDIPEEFQRYIPRSSTPPSVNRQSEHTHIRDRSVEPDQQSDAQPIIQSTAASTQFLRLLPDRYD